ncbi:MAG: hypothetical protein Q9163_003455 [Psora crenata]
MSWPPMRQARRMSQGPVEGSGESRRRSTSRSGIPVPNTDLRANRMAAIQPTYDFLSNGSGAPSPAMKPLQQPFRQSQNFKPVIEATIGNEDLRATNKTLQYELDSMKQERDYANIRHEKELREMALKAEETCRKAQTKESKEVVSIKRYETLASQLNDAKDQAINSKNVLDKELRKAKEEIRTAKEEAEEARTDLASLDREFKHAMSEVESKHTMLERTIEDLRSSLANASSSLEATKDRLSKKEAEAGRLESEVLRLKAQTGDVDTLAVIKSELSEQVAHIRKLESTNREQNAQLKLFRQRQKAVEVVQEEKRALEARLEVMEDVKRELMEAQLRRQILEDERRSWTSYLQGQQSLYGESEFETPEEMAKALVKMRLENANLVEKMGALQPEIAEQDEIIKSLEEEKHKSQAEIEKLKASGLSAGAVGGADTRTRKALERQRALAFREVEFLREQLRTFDSEEQTYHSEENQFNALKSKRIADLEAQVDDHRRELATLTSELSNLESQVVAHTAPRSSLKRPREEDGGEEEAFGHLSRKNRKLQEELGNMQSAYMLLQTEHQAIQSQLSSLQASSKTRILSLRSNPTSDHEALKLSTLQTLQQENKDLLAQLQGRYSASAAGGGGPPDGNSGLVPQSTLDALTVEMRALQASVADKEKRMLRLKQIWASKSLEFREAVFSLLGWKMDFRPNGKFALSLHTGNCRGTDEDENGDEVEETLIFDGENRTMKVAGGLDCAFARELRPLTREWVEQKRYIPGLMASVLLSKIGDGTGDLKDRFCDKTAPIPQKPPVGKY